MPLMTYLRLVSWPPCACHVIVQDQISEQGVVLATTNSGLRMPKAHKLGESVDLDTLR